MVRIVWVTRKFASQRRVSCTSGTPLFRQSICLLISYSTHSRALEGEFMFFISIFTPSLSDPFGRTEILTSHLICPFSMSQSEMPANDMVFFREFK